MSMIGADLFTGIIDLSHHQKQDVDWQQVVAAGVLAVIHKATEGVDFVDPLFLDRRKAAKAAGLLWGSYHFAGPDNDDGATQADHFLSVVKPTDDEMICYDCEKHGTLANMEAFSARILSIKNRRPMIYGRRLLRQLMADAPGSPVTKGRLWYDEYPVAPHVTPQEALPAGWAKWTLWQFTDGKNGCDPHETPGVGPCDRSAFQGQPADLREQWPF